MQILIVGVSARIHKDDTNTFVRVNKNYLDQLTSRRMQPLIIGPTNYQSLLPLCDAFLDIGGDDFDPTIYGDDNTLGLSKEVNHEVDRLDYDIIHYATNNKIPLLGICRGIQAISAVNHYPLYQDIDSSHLSHPHEGHIHEVEKCGFAPLASRLPNKFIVNTFHHQAVAELPNGYIATFKNGDIIEACEHETLPIIGFQWHPERLDTIETKIIFDYFKELTIRYKKF